MRRIPALLPLCTVLLSCAASTAQLPAGPRSPPKVKAPRTYPRLVNYFHMMDLPDARVPDREALLAQWDVVVLDPELVEKQGLSLARIRQVNPRIEILAWVPFGQEAGAPELTSALPRLSDHWLRNVRGQPAVPPWGGHMMNPWVNDFAWPRHVIAHAEKRLLVPGKYDGIMFDCLSEDPPAWASPDGTADVNGDGKYDKADKDAWQAGIAFLLRTLRARLPAAILTGNGGTPWSANAPYFAFAQGDMAENAFGNEFGAQNATFERQWAGYRAAMAKAARPQRYLLVANLRMDRSLAQAQGARGLTADDQRRFRLALTTTLLGDGYFGFDRGDSLHGQLWWFDEYDVDLGAPRGTYQVDAPVKGTLSREFARGTVVVNPTGRAVKVPFSEARTDVSAKVTSSAFELPAGDGPIYLK